MTRVVLTRPHTHAGMSFPDGHALDVDPGTADWLVAQAIAVAEPPSDRTTPSTRTTQSARTEPNPFQRKESKQ